MKKVISLLLIVLLCGMLAMPALAAPEGPVITMQPQSPNYPEYSVAIYTVKATGSNLTATWYIEYQGKTYNASQIGGSMQPWEAYAGEAYGPKKLDANTFTFIFEGIEHQLNGATIWCVLEDGHYDVTSQKAYINMGNPATPPEILEFPAQITVEQGQQAQIRCVAKSNDGSQLGYIWYETTTGELPDIKALPDCTEYGDFITCDTSNVGTRYYVCAVNTANGGITYSSVVPVTVTEKQSTAAEVKLQTQSLPQATVGEQFSFQLKCTDPEAEFFPYYNPGGKNDLEEGSWLGLSVDGWLMGTPSKAGTYGFSVCVMGANGTDYGTFELTVAEPAQQPEETTAATEPATETQETAEDTKNNSEDTTPVTAPVVTTGTAKTTVPWWVLLLVGIGAGGVGVAIAVILIKKK